MDETNSAAAEPGGRVPPTTNTVTLGGREVVVEFPSARKASVIFKRLRRVSKTVKAVTTELGEFQREYAASNSVELDRVQARLRYPEQLVRDERGELVLDEETGAPVFRSPLDALTDADWEKSGNTLRLPVSPSIPEQIGAVFETALEDGEAELWQVLAVFTMSNRELADARKASTLDDVIEQKADELLDGSDLDEVLELAVVAGEVIDTRFRRKLTELGNRVGNALRLLGIETTPEEATPTTTPQTTEEAPQTTEEEDTATSDSSSSSTPTSSTDSDEPTDGGPTPPSTATTPSSSPSASESTTSSSSEPTAEAIAT